MPLTKNDFVNLREDLVFFTATSCKFQLCDSMFEFVQYLDINAKLEI
jgi:hypothetical protein